MIFVIITPNHILKVLRTTGLIHKVVHGQHGQTLWSKKSEASRACGHGEDGNHQGTEAVLTPSFSSCLTQIYKNMVTSDTRFLLICFCFMWFYVKKEEKTLTFVRFFLIIKTSSTKTWPSKSLKFLNARTWVVPLAFSWWSPIAQPLGLGKETGKLETNWALFVVKLLAKTSAFFVVVFH